MFIMHTSNLTEGKTMENHYTILNSKQNKISIIYTITA